MGFSYNKAMVLRPQKEKALSTFLFTFLISAAVLLPYIISEVDFFTNAAENGIEQLAMFYITPKQLSGYYFPIIGTVGMVIGAPVALLAQLIPSTVLPYVSGAVMALRIALAALTGYCFIRRFTRAPQAARLGAFLYAFSSAVIGITVNNAFQNAVVIFPLVLLAAERLITENRRILLAAAVFGAALVSGYALWPMLIFTVMYVILRITSRDVKVDFLRVFAVLFELAAGALSAAILLIPIAYVCVLNTFSFGNYIGVEALFYEGGQMYFALIRSLLMPAESVNNPVMLTEATVSGGLFGAYLPLVSLAGVIAFCEGNKYSSFKRIVIASVAVLAVPMLNGVFSVANPAAGYMWFYMTALIFALTTVMALENREVRMSGGIKWAAAGTVVLALIIAFFPQSGESGIAFGLYDGAVNKAKLIRFGIYAAVAVIGIIAFAVILRAVKSRGAVLFNTLSTAVCIAAAVILWLYVATEATFYEKSLLSSFSGTNADYLSVDGIAVQSVIYYSMIVSIAALGAMIVYGIICVATRKKRREAEYEYPEGEALLELWQRYDEEDNDGYEEDEEFSLDSIAENLQMEYPVNYNTEEFKGGFNIVAEIDEKPIDTED